MLQCEGNKGTREQGNKGREEEGGAEEGERERTGGGLPVHL
jgi:hypothetical protein